MESKAHPHKTDTVGFVKGVGLPVHVSSRVLEETSNVFERSVFLSLVSRLFQVGNELVEVAVGLLRQGSKINWSKLR